MVARLSRVAGTQITREYVREINESDQGKDKYANYICYKCGEKVHIARGGKCTSEAIATKNQDRDQHVMAGRKVTKALNFKE